MSSTTIIATDFQLSESRDQQYFNSLCKYANINDKESASFILNKIIKDLQKDAKNNDKEKYCVQGYSYKKEIEEIINYNKTILKNIDELFDFYYLIYIID